jgi:hypothetical protein
MIVATAVQLPAPKLPDNLAISLAPNEAQPAKLKFVDTRQTFEALAQDVKVTYKPDRVEVTMIAGSFTWASAGKPPYRNIFKMLYLTFEMNGKMISFQIE